MPTAGPPAVRPELVFDPLCCRWLLASLAPPERHSDAPRRPTDPAGHERFARRLRGGRILAGQGDGRVRRLGLAFHAARLVRRTPFCTSLHTCVAERCEVG